MIFDYICKVICFCSCCRFEFVKQLKRKIDEALSPLIEDEIEKFAMAGQVDTSGQETLVSKITQSVIQSKPYVIFIIDSVLNFGLFSGLWKVHARESSAVSEL